MTRILLLETSERRGQVGLADADGMQTHRSLAPDRRNARDLALLVAEALAELDWKANTLTAIAVGIGPGSFTGLRVGMMSAKTLAYAVGCPLYGIPTFEAIAGNSPEDARIDVLSDALQGDIYVQPFRGVTALAPLTIRPLQSWLSDRTDAAVTGPAAELAPEPRRPENERRPTLEAMRARIPYTPMSDPLKLVPMYLKGSSAEEKRKRESALPS